MFTSEILIIHVYDGDDPIELKFKKMKQGWTFYFRYKLSPKTYGIKDIHQFVTSEFSIIVK